MSAPFCLILFAHGSHDPAWRRPFEALLEDARMELGKGAVRLAYMEFVGPTLMDVVAEAAADGVRRVRILPLFMAAGGHVSRDIPQQAEAARRAFADLDVEVLPPVGEDPRMIRVLLEIIHAHARPMP